MNSLNISKAIISAIIVWLLGVAAYVTSYFVPIMDDPDVQANWVLSIMIIPATILGAHLYYQKGYRTKGIILGSFMFLIAILLDAFITVPVFISPNGGNHRSFFGDPFFWLLGLEYITMIVIYQLIRVSVQSKKIVKR